MGIQFVLENRERIFLDDLEKYLNANHDCVKELTKPPKKYLSITSAVKARECMSAMVDDDCTAIRFNDKWRFFTHKPGLSTQDKLQQDLHSIASIADRLYEALRLADELESSPDFPKLEQLAMDAYALGITSADFVATNCKEWLDGTAIANGRPKGGRNTAKYTTDEEIKWLKEEFAIHSKKKDLCGRIAEAIFNKHGYKSSRPTVLKALRKQGLVKNA